MPTVILRTAGGDRVLSHAFREVPMPDGSIMLDLSANGGDDGEGVDLHASTHSPGGPDPLTDYANIADLELGVYPVPMSAVDPGTSNAVIIAGMSNTFEAIANGGAGTVLRGGTPGGGLTGMSFGQVTDSHFGGELLTTHGGTGLSSFTAGDTVYYVSGTALSKLPIGASGTIYTSTGSAPQWVSSLTKAQQHAQTAYYDSATAFTTTQTIHPVNAAATLKFVGDGVVAGTGYSNTIEFWDGATRGALFQATFANSAGSRALEFLGLVDRDGNRLPLKFFTQTAAGVNTVGLYIGSGAAVGCVAVGPTSAPDGNAMIMARNPLAGTGTTQYGAFVQPVIASSATSAARGGYFKLQTAAAAFTTAQLATLYLDSPTLGAGSAATVAYGAYLAAVTVGGTNYSLATFGGDVAFANAGVKVGIGLGSSGGVPTAPSAVLHVVETSGGAVPESVRLGNQSTTSGSGTEIGFHASTSGAQKYVSILGVTTAASAASGDLVLSAQKTSSGGPLERLRMVGAKECLFIANGTAAPGTPVGGGYLQVVAGVLKYFGPTGTITTLAVA